MRSPIALGPLYFSPQTLISSPFAFQLKLRPTLEEVQHLVQTQQGNTIPVYATISSDLITPVSAYLKISDQASYSFLLESVVGGEKIGRYSFVGSGTRYFLFRGLRLKPGFSWVERQSLLIGTNFRSS